MDRVTLLAAHVAAVPEDKCAALALVDLLQEDEGLPVRQAFRRVAGIMRAAAQARDLARAAELLRVESDAFIDLRESIRAECSLHRITYFTIVVVPGRQWPRLHHRPTTLKGSYWVETTVTVGARWVLAERMRQLGKRSDPAVARGLREPAM